MLWNNRHLERSQSEVERFIKQIARCVITVAIDLSTTFPFVPHSASLRAGSKGNSAQDDDYSKLQLPHK